MLTHSRPLLIPSRPLLTTFCTIALGVASLARAAFAETVWPDFRGPSGQGHSSATRLPLEWASGKNLVWRVPLAGQAWSTPGVAKGRVFLTNAVSIPGATEDAPDAGVSLRVLALDAKTGKLLWDTEVIQQRDPAALRKHDKNSHASPSPVLENGRIYAHFGHHGTACVDEAGKLIWKTQENPYAPVHGTGGSPVLVGDLLIFNADGATQPAVIALDKMTGKLRWKAPRPMSGAPNKFSFATPLVIEVKGRRQLITPGSGLVQALDPKDGSEIWRVTYGNGFSVVPRPVFAHGLLFMSSGYQQPTGLAIRPDGTGDVTETHVVWSTKKRVSLNPSMVVVGDELYMLADSGVLSCLDARTGTVHYEERLVGSSSASLLAGSGNIYAIDEQGKCAVVKAGKTFQLLATNDLAERTLASMAVCDEDLLIRTEKAIYRIAGRRPN